MGLFLPRPDRFHGHWLTIVFDKDGTRYGKGKGLRIFADGNEIATWKRSSGLLGTLPTVKKIKKET